MKSISKLFPGRLWIAAIIAVILAFSVSPFFGRFSRKAPESVQQSPSSQGRQRPGAVYKPTVMPLRHAPRPYLAVLASAPRQTTCNAEDDAGDDESEEDSTDDEDGAEMVEDGEDGNEEENDEDEAPLEEPIPDDDPALATMGNESEFAELAWSIVESPSDDVEKQISSRLESENPADRALAGVLAFLTDTLVGNMLDHVVADADPMVPLIVLDWVRDFGTDETILDMRDAMASIGLSQDYLLEVAKSSASTIGGGRSALALWLEGFAGKPVPVKSMADIIASPGVSYDVRAQAFFKLLEPETREEAMKSLDKFTGGLTDDTGVLLSQTAQKWKELSEISNSDGDDEKTWDAEARVVFYLSQSDSALPARDIANYLEYALRRDDPEFPPIVEEGTWEFANECFDRLSARRDTLPQEEIDALDRIAVSLDRLVEYDPAFNPLETVEDDDDNADEEDGEGDAVEL